MDRDVKILFFSVSILLMVGVVMIYSSSAVHAYQRYSDSMYFVRRHLLSMGLGLIMALLCMSVPPRALADRSRLILILSMIFLVVVLIPGFGVKAGGARRWLRLFGMGFQPSEMLKPALIIYLADLTSRKRHVMGQLTRGFLPPVFVIGLASVLIIMQPDMGTSVAILFVGFIILFISGARMRHIGGLVMAAVPAIAMAVAAKPYRLRRVMIFMDPWKDTRGSGFQLIQSFIALGSGGLTGVGLGRSRQKLFYLPESHTDFIFSIIGEELGFLGTSSVLLLFAVMIWFSMRIALRIKDQFASRVVMGITAMTFFEVVVNIGVSAGVLPTKGLPLPFVSYGGSSLFFHIAAIGIIMNMARMAEDKR